MIGLEQEAEPQIDQGRQFIALTAAGRKQLDHETDAWSRLTAAIGRVLEMA